MIGENIKRLMKENGYTQKQLAIRSKCTESAISRYINNKREPSFEIIKRLSIAFGVKADELFNDNQKPKKTNFDRITESVESLAEHMVHLFYETYYDCNRCEMDSRPYYTTVTGDCYYTKEGAIQHTIEWLQKECEG